MRRRLPTIFSRPRREWWSLLWVRRCSVSSLMRAVSSATCTSAEPVSSPDRPYLPISSCFLSLVSGIRGKGERLVARGLRDDLPCGLALAVHLRDQLLYGREAALSPEPADEGHAEVLAI